MRAKVTLGRTRMDALQEDAWRRDMGVQWSVVVGLEA
jgi:hypothetical protein